MSEKNEETKTNQPQNENIVIPEVVKDEPKPQPSATPVKNPKGAMIAAIICGSLAIVFAILSFVVISPFIKIFASTSNEGELFLGILMFFLYMVTLGLVSWLPALALSIAALCCSVKCWSATKKGTKAVGIIFFILSLLVLLVCVGVLVIFMIPGTVTLFTL